MTNADDPVTQSEEALRLACGVLETRSAPAWRRITAVLARQALEQGLAEYWERRGFPGFGQTSIRCQLICLREYGPSRELSARANLAWWFLSRACHHHPYELAPTYEELHPRLEDVGEVLKALESK
jgi:hypothetical protein